MDKQKQQEAYKNYVKQKTPVHNLPLNMLKAFITGGIICTIGQGILNYCRHLGIEKDISAGWTSMILILLSVLLTGFNIYPQIAKWGGAGALVVFYVVTFLQFTVKYISFRRKIKQMYIILIKKLNCLVCINYQDKTVYVNELRRR